jgi:hypothetical protein
LIIIGKEIIPQKITWLNKLYRMTRLCIMHL